MKKIAVLLVALFVLLSFPLAVFAAGDPPVEKPAPPEKEVVDVYFPDPADDKKVISSEDAGADLIGLDGEAIEDLFGKEVFDEGIVSDLDAMEAAGIEVPKYDDISAIGFIGVDSAPSSKGLLSFKDSSINAYDKVTVMQLFDGVDPVFYGDVWYDETDGTWNVWVEDVDAMALYIALIERGVDPAEAAKIVKNQKKSSKTSDDGLGMDMLFLVFILTTAIGVVAIKKVQEAK